MQSLMKRWKLNRETEQKWKNLDKVEKKHITEKKLDKRKDKNDKKEISLNIKIQTSFKEIYSFCLSYIKISSKTARLTIGAAFLSLLSVYCLFRLFKMAFIRSQFIKTSWEPCWELIA